jgi:hypothetical protein
MPRKRTASANSVTSAFRQVQLQARSLMVNLRREIRSKETELRRLKEEESRLSMLIGRQSAARSGKGTSTRGAARGVRVNWHEVLDQLPRQFKAADVRLIRGIKEKSSSEVFAAITRWIRMGLARRKARGVYRKI